MRLIDADALCKKLQEEIGSPEGHKKLMRINYLITSAPTIEAEPVRRGKWIDKSYDSDNSWECSECHEEYLMLYDDYCEFVEWAKYCPNCGAYMRGKQDE